MSFEHQDAPIICLLEIIEDLPKKPPVLLVTICLLEIIEDLPKNPLVPLVT